MKKKRSDPDRISHPRYSNPINYHLSPLIKRHAWSLICIRSEG